MNVSSYEAKSSTRRRHWLAAFLLLALAGPVPLVAQAGAYVDFFRAINIDNGRAIRSLLARGFDPNTIEPKRGDTGLILALRDDAMDVFQILLNAPGVDIDARAFNGDSALMIASFNGNKPAVEALIARGARVQHDGWTPLHYAATSGHNEIVQILLDHKAVLDTRSPNGTTPMMMAAWGGHIMTVKLLLDAGADATLKNANGMTAIDFALQNEHKDIAEGLAWRLKRAGKL